MRIVVTGGAGFIGGNVCRLLASQPQVSEVIALDDLSTGFASNLRGVAGVRLVEGSILDRPLLHDVVDGASAVIHLAARPSVPRSLIDPLASHEVNATGTMYVLEAARRTDAQVVLASSSSVYGSTVELPKHEDLPTRPLSPYGASKLAAESATLAYGTSFGLPVLAFRFFNVYGPLQAAGHAYAAVVPAFVDAAMRGEALPIYGDGRQTRDFTFVGTVAAALTEAVLRRVHSAEPINLAFGTRIDLLGLVGLLERVFERPLATLHLPARVGDIRDSQAADARLRSLFPTLAPHPLLDGLRSTVEWFRAAELQPTG